MKIIVLRQPLPYSDYYKVKDTHPNHYTNFDVFLTGEVTVLVKPSKSTTLNKDTQLNR